MCSFSDRPFTFLLEALGDQQAGADREEQHREGGGPRSRVHQDGRPQGRTHLWNTVHKTFKHLKTPKGMTRRYRVARTQTISVNSMDSAVV